MEKEWPGETTGGRRTGPAVSDRHPAGAEAAFNHLREKAGNQWCPDADLDQRCFTDISPNDVQFSLIQSPYAHVNGVGFLMQVDWDHPDILTIMAVDERDSLYPFTGKSTEKQAKAPRPAIDAARPENAILKTIVSGEIKHGTSVSASEHGLTSVVTSARERKDARQMIFDQVLALQKDGVTLGTEFWTRDRKSVV